MFIRDTKSCGKCKITYMIEAFYKNKARYDGLNPRCKKCVDEIQIGKFKQLRLDGIAKLGGKCVHCGYSKDPRGLAIDHINGGGNIEQKATRNPKKYYQNILNDTTGKYQVLCCCCNMIKRHENEECHSRADLSQYLVSEV